MADNRMLQIIIDGQADIKKDIKVFREEVNQKFKKVDENFERVNSRIDKLGASLAYLEDDTPTAKEFRKLERRVTRIERQAISN